MGALVLHCYYVGGAVLLGALLCRGRYCIGGDIVYVGALLCQGAIVSGCNSVVALLCWGRYCLWEL